MSNQIIITSGAKVRSLEGVLTGTSGLVGSVPLGAANGVATLDSGGKVPVSQLPSSVVTYLGTWNAATNTPTLVNGVGDAGDMYICNVAGTVNFGAGPVTFAVGDWVLYGSGTWQKSNGQNGTVTSVGASITGNAIGLTGSPITTAGTLAFAFSGTSGQYVNGAGNLTTFPTLITSIGLSMPSAFSVANSPLTANGSINVTGAGTVSQYIDGTGALQTFPALTGYVPYTGATTDVDLGIHVLNAQALHVKGTAGAGHLGLKHQTATPTGSANESLIFADVNGNLGWQNDNLYLTTLVSNANTANRSYTFPNASGTLALTSDISYPVTSVFGRTGAVTAQSGDYTTTLVTEGTNLYYTDARARAALSFTAGSGAYNSTTGVITIPTNTSQLTNGANFINLASLSAGTGISYNNTTGVITSTITQYTDAMARAAISGGTGISYNSTTGVITNTITQYTDALARAAISLTTTGTSGAATYNSTTGVLNIPQYTDAYTGTVTSVAMTVPTGLSVSGSPITTSGTLAVTLTAGYSIPTTASQTNWDTAYTNRITSATSPLSITSNVISISQATTSTSGYLSSTDWNTFNSKQGTITLTTTGSSGAATLVSNTLNVPNYTLSGLGGIGGSGTANYLPKFTAGTTIGNSGITDDGTTVTLVSRALRTGVIYNDAAGSGSGQEAIRILNNNGYISFFNSGNSTRSGYIQGNTTDLTLNTSLAIPILFGTSNVTKMTLDASGNLGLGVTPSAWSGFTALQVQTLGIWSASSDNYANFSSNSYFDGTNNRYISSQSATLYQQYRGNHYWYTAPSGTAGSAISFTQAMTLDASGRLLVGVTSADGSSPKAQINGSVIISDSSLIAAPTTASVVLDYHSPSNAGRLMAGSGGSWNKNIAIVPYGGNLLLGTTTDAGYKLDVNGTGRFSGSLRTTSGDLRSIGTASGSVASGAFMTLTDNATSYQVLQQLNASYGLDFWFYNGSWNKTITFANAGAATFSSSAEAVITWARTSCKNWALASDSAGGYFKNTTDSVIPIYMTNAGNVGINTTNPAVPFEVQKGGSIAYFRNNSTTAATSYITVINANNTSNGLVMAHISDGTGYFGTQNSADLRLVTGDTERMRITSGGNVLINTTTDAGYKLDVNGSGRFSSNSLILVNNGSFAAYNAGDGTYASYFGYAYSAGHYVNNSQAGDAIVRGHNGITIQGGDGGGGYLRIASTGAATFSSSVTQSYGIFTGVTPAYPTSGQGIIDGNGGNLRLFAYADINFYTNSSQNMVIKSGGNVGIAETSPASKLSIGGIQGSTIGSNVALLVGNNGAAGTVGNMIQIGLHYNPAGATPASVIGAVFTSTTGYTKSDIFFATRDVTTDTAPTERMRITSGGNVLIGTTSDDGVNKLQVNGSIAATSTIAAVVPSNVDMFVFNNTGATYTKSCVVASMTATGGTGSYFFYGQQSTSTVALKIFSNGNIQNTNNSYGAISDARLKENITDATPKLDDLLKVKVRNYNLKGEKTKQLGVISQELEEIFPNMIEESTNLGENVKIKGVKYSVFVPMLIKAVQELKAEIETLKNK